MTTRLANTIKISIPDIRAEIKKLPNTRDSDPMCRDQFLQCFRRELSWCVAEALRATEGEVLFSDLQVPSQANGQYSMNFEVFDRSRAQRNAFNFHGQNTSQWLYAGCILYQEGEVSTHH